MIIALLTDQAPELVAQCISRATKLAVTKTERKGAHLLVTIPGATPTHAEELADKELGHCVVLDEELPAPAVPPEARPTTL